MEGVKQTEVIDKAFEEVTDKEEAVTHKTGEDTQRMEGANQGYWWGNQEDGNCRASKEA